MREIKFRAWDTLNKKMLVLPVFTIASDGYVHITSNSQHYGTGQVKLMQYTGLKDKNGKGIYEGDIVSKFGKDVNGKKMESRYPVCFGLYDNGEGYDDWTGGNGWYLGQENFFRSDKREAGGWESKCSHLIDTEDLEVIGNIYENKELLDG